MPGQNRPVLFSEPKQSKLEKVVYTPEINMLNLKIEGLLEFIEKDRKNSPLSAELDLMFSPHKDLINKLSKAHYYTEKTTLYTQLIEALAASKPLPTHLIPNSVIELAVLRDEPTVIFDLVMIGKVDPNTRNSNNETLLDIAIRNDCKDVSVILTLFQKPAEPDNKPKAKM